MLLKARLFYELIPVALTFYAVAAHPPFRRQSSRMPIEALTLSELVHYEVLDNCPSTTEERFLRFAIDQQGLKVEVRNDSSFRVKWCKQKISPCVGMKGKCPCHTTLTLNYAFVRPNGSSGPFHLNTIYAPSGCAQDNRPIDANEDI